VWISSLSYVCYILRPYPAWFYRRHNIWREVHLMTLLFTQFTTVPVFNALIMFTNIQKTRKIKSFMCQILSASRLLRQTHETESTIIITLRQCLQLLTYAAQVACFVCEWTSVAF
jgi:hypothetical protein